MAKSKDDIKHGTAQARGLADKPMRVAYKAGTPLEAGKIVDSETVDFYSNARNIDQGDKIANSETVDLYSSARTIDKSAASHDVDQPQLRHRRGGSGGGTSGDVV